jgi:hypothetical protein
MKKQETKQAAGQGDFKYGSKDQEPHSPVAKITKTRIDN